MQGFTPEHDYSQSEIDSVDLDSGHLMLNIPIISYKQRGSLPDFVLKARYNQPGWTVVNDEELVNNPSWIVTQPSYVDINESTQDFPYWTYLGGGVQLVRGDSLIGGNFGTPITYGNGNPGTYTVTYVQDGNGTQHLLYLQSGSQGARAMDGSGIGATGADIRATFANLLDANGITHTGLDDGAGDGFCDAVNDPFENTITVNGCTGSLVSFPHATSWTDSIGRQIPAPPSTYPTISPGCYPYQYPSTIVSSTNQTATYTFCYTAMQFGTSFGLANITEGNAHLTVLTSIQLPNGTSYSFSYDSWGELNTVGLPDGGSITYTWGTVGAYSSSSRLLQARTVDPGDGTPLRQWKYCFSSLAPGCSNVTYNSVFDPNGNQTSRYTTINYPTTTSTTVHYQGPASNGIALQTLTSTFCNASSVFYNVPEPKLVCQTVTTLSDGETSTQVTTYDPPTLVGDPISSSNLNNDGTPLSSTSSKSIGLPTIQTVSSYGNNTAGPILKTTSTQYWWQQPINSGYLQANFLELPYSVTVADGNSNSFSQTVYGYDESNGSPQGIYGDRTSVTEGIGSTVEATAVYNTKGMVTDTYDGNINAGLQGDHVNITYDSTTGLFPSTITQSATPAAHVDLYSYDSNTGNLNSHTDQNGNTTTWTYDNMGRATSVLYPGGGGSTYCYTDEGGGICQAAAAPYSTFITTNLSSGTVMSSSVSYNGLGQTVTQTGPGGAATTTQYDLLGRVGAVSNPYFVANGSPSQWTQTSYDGLGRPTTVTNPDGTTRATSYRGSTTTTTDEATNSWTSTSDALGRMTGVTEPGEQQTSYSYDPLNNLLNINQRGVSGDTPRTRSFNYDSLSRLLTSTNPETGTVCYGLWSSSNCVSGYDADGNLLYRTDASGWVVSYTYDALNRMLTKYSGVENTTNYSFTYDQGSNGIGRLYQEENAFTSGQLLSATQFQYDPMGRVTSTNLDQYGASQWQPGLQVQYDLAGNVIQLTYADGRVVSQSWDGAGHLSSVNAGPLGGGGAPYLSGAQYFPSGALQSATYGNGVSQAAMLNSRLQPCHQMDSSPLFPSSTSGGNLMDRQLFYGVPSESNCGNAQANNGNIHNVLEGVGSPFSQSFVYDNLNRLTQANSVNRPAAATYNQIYNYDSFGNMLLADQLNGSLNFGIDDATNRLTLNGNLSNGNLQYNANGTLAQSPDGVGGYYAYMWTGEGNLRGINENTLGYGIGSYVYDSMGERVLAVHPSLGGSTVWYEYVYLDGQPMADVDNNGVWTDYIYANGQKIALAKTSTPVLHLSGICGDCSGGGSNFYVSSLAIFLSGYTIRSGDRLIFRQKQDGPAQAGLYMYATDGTNSMGSLTDSAGNWINSFNDDSNTWQTRTVDLSSWAGKQISTNLGVSVEANTASGEPWDSWITDVALVSVDGTSIPVYNGQSYGGSPWGSSAGSSFAISNDSDPAVTTHYYLADQVGTTQMELAAGGWPVWQGYFTPFGEEIQNGVEQLIPGQVTADGTSDRYKFTGKERDAESGNDYFGARYYGSSMGRFMSPDPSGLSFANPANPQSLNLYSYALNNPLINIDPTGMECVWDDGSYDSADDPQTGNAAGCSGQGGTYVNPDLFENALLTNGQNANIQYGSWSGSANSTLASSWTTASGTAYGSQWAAGQEVDEAVNLFYGNGAKPTIIYNNNDPFTMSFKNSLGMQGIMAGITSNCSATSGSVPVGTGEAFANTMIDGPFLKSADGSIVSGYYTPEAQLGGFNSTYSRSGGVVNITVTNAISLNSFALHATAPLGIPNPSSGHFGTVNQQLNITAPDPCGGS
jgi:RHS repeat-associated protein